MWSDVFEEGVDILVSTEQLSYPNHAMHRGEYDKNTMVLDGDVFAATTTGSSFYDMSWDEFESEFVTIQGNYGGEVVFWEANFTLGKS